MFVSSCVVDIFNHLIDVQVVVRLSNRQCVEVVHREKYSNAEYNAFYYHGRSLQVIIC